MKNNYLHYILIYFNIRWNWPCYSCSSSIFERFRIKRQRFRILVAIFSLSQMIISPFGGSLADKLGKN